MIRSRFLSKPIQFIKTWMPNPYVKERTQLPLFKMDIYTILKPEIFNNMKHKSTKWVLLSALILTGSTVFSQLRKQEIPNPKKSEIMQFKSAVTAERASNFSNWHETAITFDDLYQDGNPNGEVTFTSIFNITNK